MAVHKYLDLIMTCPRCGAADAPIEVELKVGHVTLERLTIGSQIDELKGINTEVEGYASCELCERDFWISAIVRDGVIVKATYKSEDAPYIPGPRRID